MSAHAKNFILRIHKSWIEFHQCLLDVQFCQYYEILNECFDELLFRIKAIVDDQEFKLESFIHKLEYMENKTLKQWVIKIA